MSNKDKDNKEDNNNNKESKNEFFDDTIFKQDENKVTNEKKKKKSNKKGKGIDFLEYAKDNGIAFNIQYEDIKPSFKQFISNEKRTDFKQEKRNDKDYYKAIPQNTTTATTTMTTTTSTTTTQLKKEEKQQAPKDDIIIEKETKEYKKYDDNEDKQRRYNQDYGYERNKEQYYDDYQDNRNYYRKNDQYRRDNYQQKDQGYYNDKRDQYNNDDYNYSHQSDYKRKPYNYDNNNRYYDDIRDQGNNYYKKNDDDYFNYDDNFNKDYYNNNRKNQRFTKVIEKELEEYPRETTKGNQQQEQLKEVGVNQPMAQSQTQQFQQKDKPQNDNKEKISSNKFDKPNQKTDQKYSNPESSLFDYPTMKRMNYYANIPQMNVHPYAPQMSFPIREEDIHEALEYYFSIKNLNKDIFIREAMDEEGWVTAECILTFNKMKDMKVTSEKIESIISKIGSDIVEIGKKDNALILLRPKHYVEEIKEKIKPIQQIKEEKEIQMQKAINQRMTFPNQIPLGPLPYYAPQQPAYYPMMNMNMYMQPRPPFVGNPNQIQYAQYYQKNQ